MKMSFPCERHAIFRKTRDRIRSEIFKQNGLQLPQEIEPGLPKHIKGTLPITAQTSKSHFQRDRCVFGKSTCRPHGKLIFMHWAFTFDAKTCHGPILGTARNFFVPQGCSSSNGEAMARQWRGNEEAMGRQCAGYGEAMARLVRIFLGGFLIQWGNQGESE